MLYGKPNGLSYSRLGLTVGRGLGTAVVRGRFKRLCREAFRLSKDRQPSGWDWIVLPRRRAKKKAPRTRKLEFGYREVADDLLYLMKRVAANERRRERDGQNDVARG
ncbi:Ribonuclease P protein component [Planctomycetes bacterium Pan216]|uniref:Ribonuclease P protein component n=1 Tax=Kolteria novifilia TaxID=2527975 RepID=A0A518AYF5_9BACT|nr:Ribonuclease P protein component [Planctomycetes bacterium Pan216]